MVKVDFSNKGVPAHLVEYVYKRVFVFPAFLEK